MLTDYHITSINYRNTNDLGKIILVDASPYEDTPWGYCYVINKSITMVFPYSISLFKQIQQSQEDDDFQIDLSKFELNSQYGWYIHEKCYQKESNIPLNPIDLGLSVLWADKNIGAFNIEDYGVMKSYNEVIIENIEINNWRLPTSKEFQELIDLQIKHKSTNKLFFFSDNCNKLFLPPAGVMVGYNTYREGQWGDYLGRFLGREDAQCSFTVSKTDRPFIRASFNADIPFSIRLVKDK